MIIPQRNYLIIKPYSTIGGQGEDILNIDTGQYMRRQTHIQYWQRYTQAPNLTYLPNATQRKQSLPEI